MADYPGAIFTQADVPPGTNLGGATPTHRVRENNMKDEIVATETELGINPHLLDATVTVTTTPATVKQKTDVLSRRIADIIGTFNGAVGISLGGLAALFDATTGHTHSGSGTNGPKADAGKLQGRNFSSAAPSVGNVPVWNGTAWTPTAGGGGGAGTLIVEELDGVPSGIFDTLKVSNGSLTDNGDGSATLVVGGGGGGGGTVGAGALGSRPAAGTAGALYLPSDAPYVYEDNGSTWNAYGPIRKLVPPVPGSFSWVNQSGSVLDTSHGILTVKKAVAGSASISGQFAAPGAAPWEKKLTLLLHPPYGTSTAAGFGFYDSVGGKLVVLNFFQELATLRVDHMTSTTAFGVNVDAGQPISYFGKPGTFSLGDDSTNIYFDYLPDGYTPTRIWSEGRTAYLANAPDKIGFFVFDNSLASGRLSIVSLYGYE